VRQSAKRVLRDVFRAYNSLEHDDPVVALASEFESVAVECSGTQWIQFIETKADVAYTRTAPVTGIVGKFTEFPEPRSEGHGAVAPPG
jgi:hypothetical protein